MDETINTLALVADTLDVLLEDTKLLRWRNFDQTKIQEKNYEETDSGVPNNYHRSVSSESAVSSDKDTESTMDTASVHGSLIPESNNVDKDNTQGSLLLISTTLYKDSAHGSLQPESNTMDTDSVQGSSLQESNTVNTDSAHGYLLPESNPVNTNSAQRSLLLNSNTLYKDSAYGSLLPEFNPVDTDSNHESLLQEFNTVNKDSAQDYLLPESNPVDTDSVQGSLQQEYNTVNTDSAHGYLLPKSNTMDTNSVQRSLLPNFNPVDTDSVQGSLLQESNTVNTDSAHGYLLPESNPVDTDSVQGSLLQESNTVNTDSAHGYLLPESNPGDTSSAQRSLLLNYNTLYKDSAYGSLLPEFNTVDTDSNHESLLQEFNTVNKDSAQDYLLPESNPVDTDSVQGSLLQEPNTVNTDSAHGCLLPESNTMDTNSVQRSLLPKFNPVDTDSVQGSLLQESNTVNTDSAHGYLLPESNPGDTSSAQRSLLLNYNTLYKDSAYGSLLPEFNTVDTDSNHRSLLPGSNPVDTDSNHGSLLPESNTVDTDNTRGYLLLNSSTVHTDIAQGFSLLDSSTADIDSIKGSLLPDSNVASPSVSENLVYRLNIGDPHSLEFHDNESTSCRTENVENKFHEKLERPVFQAKDDKNGHFVLNKEIVEARLKQVEIGNDKRNVILDSKDATVLSSEIIYLVPEIVEDTRHSRNFTTNWDPRDLLMELYKVEFSPEDTQESTTLLNIEGYLEKLPLGVKNATYWNPWKRKYFCARNGFLFSYDSIHSEKPSLELRLMGGTVDILESNIISVDDKREHSVILKCRDEKETNDWFQSLQTHCHEDFSMVYVQPVRYPLKCHKDVVIVDVGSFSIRAGILMDHPTLPQMFFPTICATNKYCSKKHIFGLEALNPKIRCTSDICFPVSSCAKRSKCIMDVEKLSSLFKKIFQELNIDPRKYKVQLSIPRTFSLQSQSAILKTLFDEFGVSGVSMTRQAILALYAYNTTSGIVVDIGDGMDIIPINYGYIIENGITKLSYGGQHILQHLRQALIQKYVSLTSDIETYLLRFIQEQICFVSHDYKKDLEHFSKNPEIIKKTLVVKQFFQTEFPWENISLDIGRFQTPEGLFTPELWGVDYPGVHNLVYRAFQACSMDIRREMARNIYLSGGVTLLPGFAKRLETELGRLTPPKVVPKVHASPYRYHMAYLGACQLAASHGFDETCASLEEWSKKGSACLKRWRL
ncbi:uncharacterized protein LOC143226502 [Tachypleus tridentatus]|uniref:uncharacterized protein LOC143226502 n=1 Tax=Tachypleus tridentatus TaxID=6853 RepID=UPI003FD23C97